MLTINDAKHIFNLDHYSYACKSTDEKPTHAVENSLLLELDTNTVYYYTSASGWVKLKTSGGGGGGGTHIDVSDADLCKVLTNQAITLC